MPPSSQTSKMPTPNASTAPVATISYDRTLAQGALAWLWARRPSPFQASAPWRRWRRTAVPLQFGPLTAGQMAEVETLLGR